MMTGLGHSRRIERAPFTSGLPRLADILRVGRHVSKVPTSDMAAESFFHSMISSARPMSEVGTVSPSALAVFRLIASWTFVTCCTGRSAGARLSRAATELVHRSEP